MILLYMATNKKRHVEKRRIPCHMSLSNFIKIFMTWHKIRVVTDKSKSIDDK
jgi:hypothetical protein